jgi:UDP-glucose 4-epimerase
MGARRAGDPATLFADASAIRRDLGWQARFTDLDEIVATAWRWRSAHADGYR